MSQQVIDVRRSAQIIRRHKILVGTSIVLGFLAGAAYGVLYPPLLTSTALVVLPPSAQSALGAANGGPDPYTATEELIANSNQVLQDALPNVRPVMSLNELRSRVQAGVPAPDIISITAEGKTAVEAEATANAVTESYIAYVDGANSPVGRISARMLAPATSAAGSGQIIGLLIPAIIGGLAGALVALVVSLALGRSDRRLRERDEIATSIGIPVLASIPVLHPSDAKGWMRLLEDYKPGSVHAWQLRKALRHLGRPGDTLNSDNNSGSSPLVVLSLSSDPRALALGPQLAVFNASLEIPTLLVVGPQQDVNATAALRTACAVPRPASSKRPNHLRVTVSDDGQFDARSTELTVIVAVVDSHAPQMPEMARTSKTVLAVSAGAVTAEQLARAAVSATADGREIDGIIIADPEPTDHTTGHIPRLAEPVRRRLPMRLTNTTTEIRR